jgi:hypothetical protein
MVSTLTRTGDPMRTIAFNSFPQDEQEIFRSSCVRWGKRPDDFLVSAEELDSPGRRGPAHREVTVEHIPSSKARTYRAGRGAGWIGDFEDDLQAVYFGRTWQFSPSS